MTRQDFQLSPLTKNQISVAEQLLSSLNDEQLLWFNGYITGISKANEMFLEIIKNRTLQNNGETINVSNDSVTSEKSLKVLYGTQSGNSEFVAENIIAFARNENVPAQIKNLSNYNSREFKKEEFVIIVISTQGEGEPPIDAEAFYKTIMSDKMPRLENLNYGIIALGDSSYRYFCKIGIDLDKRLESLGAKRIHDLIKCDIDFETPTKLWISEVIPKFKSIIPQSTVKVKSAINTDHFQEQSKFNKRNPFQAEIIDRIKLNGRGSSKENFHVEISLEGSGLSYEPGDSLGVFSKNNSALVDEIISKLKFNADDKVVINESELSLNDALINNFELTILTPIVLENYFKITNNNKLKEFLDNEALLHDYITGRDVLDLISEFPSDISVNQFFSILRKLSPRLYSISSSFKAFPDEVHLTVNAVQFERTNRKREGVCSNFLTQRIKEDDRLSVYVEKNDHFRLPKDSNIPIIMIGPGTGVAPFRAFIQEREYISANGKNWLFFGDQHFTTDFLYQEEWLRYKKNGILTNMDVAFSRDQSQKVYVQHKMYEKSRELFRWIEEGAFIYICGDKKNMATDVKRALYNIISKEGGHTDESASIYFDNLKKSKRLLEDVY